MASTRGHRRAAHVQEREREGLRSQLQESLECSRAALPMPGAVASVQAQHHDRLGRQGNVQAAAINARSREVLRFDRVGLLVRVE